MVKLTEQYLEALAGGLGVKGVDRLSRVRERPGAQSLAVLIDAGYDRCWPRFTFRDVSEHGPRDIELAHRSECLRDPSQVSEDVFGIQTLIQREFGARRQRLAKPSRRHAKAVNAAHLAALCAM